jgi:acetate kinase
MQSDPTIRLAGSTIQHTADANDDAAPLILTINGGSSSIKFAVFSGFSSPNRLLSGQVERVGTAGASLTISAGPATAADVISITGTREDCVSAVVQSLRQRLGQSPIRAIGHRIVHGGLHLFDHQLVTAEVVAELRRSQPLDLAHLPQEISLIETFGRSFPGVPQFACFDTAFHRDIPRVAQLLPIPLHYTNTGVRRFGFHGLSYTYLMNRLAEIDSKQAANGRVILAHLGSGASMAAVLGGKPMDTTMAFTPNAGLMMATRTGDLDPGLLIYLMNEREASPEEMDRVISQQCGLLGVSETSADMRDLLKSRDTDPRAADAIDLFCYQAKKHLCALVSILGGLDTLIFAGGIGEHLPAIRAQICQGLQFLGLTLDSTRNERNEGIISADPSLVTVRVIRTDEEIILVNIIRLMLKPEPHEVGCPYINTA